MINPYIFRAYDIRGIAHKPKSDLPVDLNPQTMELIGKGAGTYFKRIFGTNLCISHDNRLSNPELSDAFIKGVLSTGCKVTNLGMISTPMLYFSVCKFKFDGGAQISASHNPKEYNGIKLVGQKAHSICGDDLQEILKLIQKEDFEKGEGKMEYLKIFPAYLEKISSMIHPAKKLKIVVDSGNGATGPYVKQLFESLGCEVICLFTEPDGNFPNHEANPEEIENMQDLIKTVIKNKADVGFGFDGDGDRLGVVDEKGQHYSADLILLLLARDILTRQKGAKIVFDVKVSQILINDINNSHGEAVMTKTGHSFIETKMREIGAPLAGEISGHLFFAENYYGFDDAFLAAAKIIEIAAKSNQTFSHFFESIPKTFCTPELKLACPDNEKFKIVNEIKKEFEKKYPCITIDGVRVNFDKDSWGALRCSNTSPNLTARFEAQTQEKLKEIMKIMLEELKKYPQINLNNFKKWDLL